MEGDKEFYKEYFQSLSDEEIRGIFDGDDRVKSLARGGEGLPCDGPNLMGGGGHMTLYTLPKPKTLADAKRLAQKIFDGENN